MVSPNNIQILLSNIAGIEIPVKFFHHLPHCCKSLNRSAIPLKSSGISAQLQQDKGAAVVRLLQTLDNEGAGRFRLSHGQKRWKSNRPNP